MFAVILRNFSGQLFLRTRPGDCLWRMSIIMSMWTIILVPVRFTRLCTFSTLRRDTGDILPIAFQGLAKFGWNVCDLMSVKKFSRDRYFVGCLGYPALGPRPLALIKISTSSTSSYFNLFLFKVKSLWLCAHYFQWFTGHLKHVDLLILHVSYLFIYLFTYLFIYLFI